MSFNTGFIFFTAAALALPAFGDHQENWHPRFRGLDHNSDGAISRGEWKGNTRSFTRHDWNNDGLISGDELTGRNPRARRDSADRYRGDSTNRSDRGWENQRGSADRYDSANLEQYRAGHFRALDRNADGKIQAGEWKADSRVFHSLDRDFDSELSWEEFMDRNRDVFVRDLDRNRDNVISRNEWNGTDSAFEQLDRNRDQVLDSDEFFYRGAHEDREDRFRQVDKDRNGIIEGPEWRGDPELFHKLDTNRDSKVDFNEFMTSGVTVFEDSRRSSYFEDWR
jgi:Ca2+-binding EF-hand superfamily protein